MNNEKTVEQMQQSLMSSGAIASKASGGIPAGSYRAKFTGIEFLPALEPDPMTGKSARQYAAVRFKWEIVEGEHAGKIAIRECPPNNTSLKSKFLQTVAMLIRKSPEQGYDLQGCIGQAYTIGISNKLDKNGKPTTWLEVSQCL